MRLLKVIALRMGSTGNRVVSVDDFIQWGWFGMRRAIERFDPTRGISFKSFASPHIRGAMIDGLRNWNWVPRGERDKGGEIPRFISSDQDDDRAGESWASQLKEMTAADTASDQLEQVDQVNNLTKCLPELHQQVMRMWALTGLDQVQIARAIGVSESYVSQIFNKSIELLKERHENNEGKQP